MDLTISLTLVTIIGTVAGIAGYFLMRQKFLSELAYGKKRESELARKAYETAVLKEIGDRIGYSLDATKIIEIISGSLGDLLPYSTVSHMVLSPEEEKIQLQIQVNQSVNKNFIADVKMKMLAAFSEMLQEPLVDIDVDERIAGKILDETLDVSVKSFFNLPITISGKVVGLINIASVEENLYDVEETEVLYRIAKQASEAVSKLQDVLENEKGRLVQALESLSDGVLMASTGYQLILANKKLREILRLGENPKIFDVASALSGKLDLRTKMEEAIQRPEPLPVEEIEIGDKILSVSASRVLFGRTQKPIGVVVMFHDVTDAKSLEKLRQDFITMMVHELRAPLTSIKSTVEMIEGAGSGRVSSDDLAKYLATIDSTSETMLELVSDLLDVAKVEAGKFDVICDDGDLAEVVLERVESFKPLAAAKNLRVEVSFGEDLPRAWFDKVRIKQVMNNLLSNAIKYTDTGSITVKVVAQKVNGQAIDILVAVADTGIGIAPEAAARLFSKFGQLESGRNKAGLKSSGLGLYITKKIVEAAGGKIWVESAGPGRGSTFFFTVSLAANARNLAIDQNSAIPSRERPIKDFTSQKVGQA